MAGDLCGCLLGGHTLEPRRDGREGVEHCRGLQEAPDLEERLGVRQPLVQLARRVLAHSLPGERNGFLKPTLLP